MEHEGIPNGPRDPERPKLIGNPIVDFNQEPQNGASLVSSVGSMVPLLTGWYRVRLPVGLALHLISPHPRVCK